MKRLTIGRDNTCDIIIVHDRVSRFHANITPDGNGYIFRDTSSNGTLINGVMVRNSERRINYGDKVLLAGNLPLPWNRIPNTASQGYGSYPTAEHNNQRPPQYAPPQQPPAAASYSPTAPSFPPPPPQSKTNGLGITGFVLAIIAVFLGWIPILGWIMWALGLIFSAVGVFRTPKGLAIAGLVISLIDLILLLVVFASLASIFGGLGGFGSMF